MPIGIDIVDVSRIEKLVKYKNFYQKVFTEQEFEYIKEKEYNHKTIAGLLATKEAVAKAFGNGIFKFGWKNIEIIHDDYGKPFINSEKNISDILVENNVKSIEMSVSHDGNFAISVASLIIDEGKHFIKSDTKRYEIVEDLVNSLLERDDKAHKGNFGKIGIIAGSEGMVGAAQLVAMGALKAGAGVVYNLIPKSLYQPLQIKALENIVIPIEDNGEGFFTYESTGEILEKIKDFDAIALGNGIGRNRDTKKLIFELIRRVNKPMVIDADAINLISENPGILNEKTQPIIITPHAMEMSRLSGYPIDGINDNRVRIATKIADRFKVIVLLKGNETIIADEYVYYINSTGNPGMATAGSGDVLSGIISAFLGKGYNPLLCARFGAYIHGIAGDMARDELGSEGMIASDIVNKIAYAIKYMEDNKTNE